MNIQNLGYDTNLKVAEQGEILLNEGALNTEYQFVCPFSSCKKSFKEKGNLKTHIRIHV